MYTQNTPVHLSLWHKNFWLLAFSNMLVSLVAYMLIPIIPLMMGKNASFAASDIALVMAGHGIGIFVLGGFCSYLIQKYRRNVVCCRMMAATTLTGAAMVYILTTGGEVCNIWVLSALSLLMGAAFGLSQMILCSTLVIDVCESSQRTEANYSASWFGRFALSLGPVMGLLSYRIMDNEGVLYTLLAAGVLALVLLLMVKFPFKTPEDDMKLMSTDRFILKRGWPLFINLFLVTFVVGLILTIKMTLSFYGMMMGGFLLALVSQRVVFVNADLKSEMVAGLLFLGSAILLILLRRQIIVEYVSPVLIGWGIGLIGARFLLFYIKLSRHCERGTSQSTFFLAFEAGLYAGLAAGFSLFYSNEKLLLITALVVVVMAMVLYNSFTHRWYIKHKNR